MKKIVVVAALAAVAFASAPALAGEKSTAELFAEAHEKCVKDNFRFCGKVNTFNVTVEKFCEVSGKSPERILTSNGWDKKMLKAIIPVGSTFRL